MRTQPTRPPLAVLSLDATDGVGKEVLGGKAWSVARMRSLGLPVPPAFVIITDVCRRYYAGGRKLPVDVLAALPEAVADLERATGGVFGGGDRPLLVSVRSGAAASMPGMMDTVLNLGMTVEVERLLAEYTGGGEYAADTRRRFVEQFEKVVGAAAPDDPWEQLRLAVTAVLDSWDSRRAVAYRERRGLSHDGGTAVTVQAMVFGNLDPRSGTGVLFTRNPLTGTAEPYGEWLPRGQGEDVVSGRADALPLDALARAMPAVHGELMSAASVLETDSRDVLDIEFTVESGKLWLLQSRPAKRSPEAVVRHAVLLNRLGLISPAEALDRVHPDDVRALLAPRLSSAALASAALAATGKPACPGIATGVVVCTGDAAEDRADLGEKTVLGRPTTDPDDVSAMSVSQAVLTEQGGSTSHAAVVCREMGVPCVVGCGTGTVTTLAGQTVTVDGTTGNVYLGELPVTTSSEHDDPDLLQLAEWARSEPRAEVTAPLPELLRRRSATPL